MSEETGDKIATIFGGAWLFSVGWMIFSGIPIFLLGDLGIVSEDAAIISIGPIFIMCIITLMAGSGYMLFGIISDIWKSDNEQ